MQIRFYNSLTHQVEDFQPLRPPQVSMYNCGPTVYDYAHIGNFRAFIFADVLRRFLELTGHQVRQVMNITDVGHMTEDQLADGGGLDKMQVAIERVKEAKKAGRVPVDAVGDPGDPYQIAEYYTRAFLNDARSLQLKIADEYPANMPRATQYIPAMQQMIEQLIERGHAYMGEDGAIYYSVQSFPSYGQLSGNTLDKLRGGAGGRVSQEQQAAKRHPADFLLWKPDQTHLMKWDSPWGAGYPGWHIECSAMATTLHHSDVIDIHTGGEDNIFPHHECEIAQTCGASGKSTFAKLWMHTRFLLVDGQKMSKSKGNFYTVRDLLDRGAEPAALRFELLKGHYRSNVNFTFKSLEDSASAIRKLRQAWSDAQREAGKESTVQVDASHPALAAFVEALADDLNTAGAIGALFRWLGDARDPQEVVAVLQKADTVLAVLEPAEAGAGGGESAADDEAAALCKAIDDARQRKDFAHADELRKQLTQSGYEVQTTKQGTTARRRLA